MNILVTVGGECFEATYEQAGPAEDRDGTLFYFRVRDLRNDRGRRSVSLFLSGTERVFIKDYDSRIETVRLNCLRRAFDSGSFSFDTPVVRDRLCITNRGGCLASDLATITVELFGQSW